MYIKLINYISYLEVYNQNLLYQNIIKYIETNTHSSSMLNDLNLLKKQIINYEHDFSTLYQNFNNLTQKPQNDSAIIYGDDIISKYPYDDTGGVHTIYIYSDVVDPVYVGDSFSNLLRIVKVSDYKFGSHNSITFEHPIYIPVHGNELRSIRINIKDDAGDDIQFEFGRVNVISHFTRKCRSFT